MQLLTTNSKLAKCEKFGYLAMGLELAPGKLGGRGELCADRGDCYKTCLFNSGFGSMPAVRKARIDRTRFVFNTDGPISHEALIQLEHEIGLLERRARKRKLRAAVRLNVFSDVDWVDALRRTWFLSFPHVKFYDYTKNIERWRRSLSGGPAWPFNYDLTFSTSEEVNVGDISDEMKSGGRCTVVARKGSIWDDWIGSCLGGGTNVVDGDEHDLTFLHPKRTIIVLAAKGKAGSRNPRPNKFIP